MTNLLLIGQLIFATVQFLMGILSNGIIVLVSSLECIKRKKVTAYDLLLTSLGISRIFLQGLLIVIQLFFLSALQMQINKGLLFAFTFVNEVNLWIATYLCVFYCVKIANIFHPFFFWLKMRISNLVPWLILGSLLFSIVITVSHYLQFWPITEEELRRYLAGNVSAHFFFQLFFPDSFLVVGIFMPLLIFNAASALLIWSLCRHTRQMRNAATDFRDPGTEVHIRAMKSVFSFFVLYFSYYIGMMIVVSRISPAKDFLMFFCFSLAALYPSLHSIILILGSPKLKCNTRHLLLWIKSCLGGGPTLNSTQNPCCF